MNGSFIQLDFVVMGNMRFFRMILRNNIMHKIFISLTFRKATILFFVLNLHTQIRNLSVFRLFRKK
jgi:hypothetical protein